MNKNNNKNKYLTAFFAYFLGGFGVHRFYLGDFWHGLFYFLFCWTLIPFLASFFEVFYFLFMSQEEFDRRYNGANALPYNPAAVAALPAPPANYYQPVHPMAAVQAPQYQQVTPQQAPNGVDGSVASVKRNNYDGYNGDLSRGRSGVVGGVRSGCEGRP